MKEFGINKVYYSTDLKQINVQKVQDLNITHLSIGLSNLCKKMTVQNLNVLLEVQVINQIKIIQKKKEKKRIVNNTIYLK
jgi:hypothetical protein